MVEKKKIEDSKRHLRAAAKQKRDSLSQTEMAQWSSEICKVLEEQSFFRESGIICFYYPLGSEADLLPLAQKALDLGKQAAFPRVEGSEMGFYRVSDLEGFAEGAFHVMEPVGGGAIHSEEALVLVPGLIFDNYGNRMGYGKGYYDKYFARYPGCRKIGVCYGMQVVPNVPCGEYDIPMEAVVTEYGVLKSPGGSDKVE